MRKHRTSKQRLRILGRAVVWPIVLFAVVEAFVELELMPIQMNDATWSDSESRRLAAIVICASNIVLGVLFILMFRPLLWAIAVPRSVRCRFARIKKVPLHRLLLTGEDLYYLLALFLLTLTYVVVCLRWQYWVFSNENAVACVALSYLLLLLGIRFLPSCVSFASRIHRGTTNDAPG